MRTYFFPIQAAFLSFPIIALILVLPFAIISYRKHGRFAFWPNFLLFAFIFYLQCAYFLVILPLPNPDTIDQAAGYNLIPFRFLYEMVVKAPSGIALLTSTYFLEPVFNILLTVPFGLFIAYFTKKKLKTILIYSFLLSLFFELTQLSGLYGIYPNPYRSFDVNDLILNTLGGGIGYYLQGIIPNLKTKAPQQTISYTRRLIAFIIDNVIISLLSSAINGFVGLPELYTLALTFFAYFYLLGFLWQGQTIGKSIVKIRVKAQSKLNLLYRYTLRNSWYFLIIISNDQIKINSNQKLISVIFFACLVLSLIDYLYSFFHRKQLWYERLSQTENIGTNQY